MKAMTHPPRPEPTPSFPSSEMFREWMVEMRMWCDLSQQRVADDMGYSRRKQQLMEYGQCGITLDDAHRIALYMQKQRQLAARRKVGRRRRARELLRDEL